MNPTLDAEAAWRWCCDEYARAGRAAELLRAQDEEGADVVLLLFVQYAREQLAIEVDAAQAQGAVRRWREQAVAPLRALRRALKDEPAQGAGGVEEVRALVRQAELRAERVELEALCAWLSSREQRGAALRASRAGP